MKLRVYLLTLPESFMPPVYGSYTKQMIVIDYNVQNIMRKYEAYNIEQMGLYTGKEKEPCVICREIINYKEPCVICKEIVNQ